MDKIFDIDASLLVLGEAGEAMSPCGELGTEGVSIQPNALEAFKSLHDDAAREGFDLRIHSGFRSFDSQLSIWNRKACGELAVLDDDSMPLDIGLLSETELMFRILRWSALPGASRHHWGSDIDYYEHNAFAVYGKIDLIPQEYSDSGPFAEVNRWLDSRITQNRAYSFFKPYSRDLGGVNPEPWHLSWSPLANSCQSFISKKVLISKLQNSSVLLKDSILQNIDLLRRRYITNVETFR